MRLFSGLESVRRGEPSVLAIVETMIASGISIWLAWWENSIQHILIASALAPLLLLRNRVGIRFGVNIWLHFGEYISVLRTEDKSLDNILSSSPHTAKLLKIAILTIIGAL